MIYRIMNTCMQVEKSESTTKGGPLLHYARMKKRSHHDIKDSSAWFVLSYRIERWTLLLRPDFGN